jgi:hypothetical protein
MVCMLFFGFGVDKDIVNEDNDKFIQELHKNLIHEVHEISRGIGQSK